MDILPGKPVDESRGPKDLFSQRPTGASQKEVGKGLVNQAETPAEAPDADGLLAAPEAESGSTRDAAAENQTKDYAAERLAAFLDDLGPEARQPGATRLEIEVDHDTEQARFVLLSRETGEVLKKIPAEDMLPKLRDLAQKGMLFDHRF